MTRPQSLTEPDDLWEVVIIAGGVAGNTANPATLVPIAAASGVTVAVTINAELVAQDLSLAMEQLAAVA